MRGPAVEVVGLGVGGLDSIAPVRGAPPPPPSSTRGCPPLARALTDAAALVNERHGVDGAEVVIVLERNLAGARVVLHDLPVRGADEEHVRVRGAPRRAVRHLAVRDGQRARARFCVPQLDGSVVRAREKAARDGIKWRGGGGAGPGGGCDRALVAHTSPRRRSACAVEAAPLSRNDRGAPIQRSAHLRPSSPKLTCRTAPSWPKYVRRTGRPGATTSQILTLESIEPATGGR